jgi:superfamily II DNA or RNA helicase
MTEGFDLSAQVGYDVPIEALIDGKPTDSTALATQINGRVMRPKPRPGIIIGCSPNWKNHGLPCSEKDWSLDGKPQKGKEMADVAIRRCAACMRPFKPAPSCPYCGATVPVKERTIEHDESVGMVKIDKEQIAAMKKAESDTRRKEEGQCRTLQDLMELARERGYKPAWAIMRWKSRGN